MAYANYTTVSLRPYQEGAVFQLRRSFSEGNKRVMVYAPTGAGKSELAVGIAQLSLSKSKRVLFLVHRKDLVRQQVERFNRYGMDVGILQGENTWRPNSPVTVGSIQTFSSRRKFGWQFDFDMVIVDEAHLCAASKQYLDLFKSWNNVPIVGLSATPFSKGLGRQHDWGRVFEDMVIVSTIQALIEENYLVDCEIYAPSEPDLSKVRTVAGDYHEGDLGEAVNKADLIGDIVKNWNRLAKGHQTICFATNIAHSKNIVEQFTASGVSAVHADCYMPDEDRQEAIRKFRAGEVTVLSNVALFAEGFDAPETKCMILARPTKSLIRYIQMAGRVLRPAEGKDKALILDHSGTVKRLGFPTDDLPLELDDGKAKESKASKQKEKLPKVCTSCGYVDSKNRHTCPMCHFTPERKAGVEIQEGDLQRIKKAKITKDDKQAIYSALVARYNYFNSKKPMKQGWVANNYRGITGVWPRDLIWKEGPMLQRVESYLTHQRIKWAKGRA